jgi:hypothetical protein
MTPLIKGIVAWTALAFGGLVAIVIALGVGGVMLPGPADKEVSGQKPFSDFIGREYRVTGDVTAHAWNDFPDKEKILTITLMTPPGVANRFVSYRRRLDPGQSVRIVSAWRSFAFMELNKWHIYYYVVSLPGNVLTDAAPIHLSVESDGSPDPRFYEPVVQK